MRKKPKDADTNYDFRDKGDKRKPVLGDGAPSNLPERAIIRPFPRSEDYRGGICNNPASSVEDVSNIEENEPSGGYL